MKTLLFAALALISTPAFAENDWDRQRKAHISCEYNSEVIMCRTKNNTYNGMMANVTDQFYDMNGRNTMTIMTFPYRIHTNALRHQFRLAPACNIGVCHYYPNAKVGMQMFGETAYVTIVR